MQAVTSGSWNRRSPRVSAHRIYGHGAKVQEGIKSFRADLLSNHEADDYPFRFSSTGFNKVHPCGKVQVDDWDIIPSLALAVY